MYLAQQLRPWITVYSALLKDCEHGDSVTVGGRIIDMKLINIEDEESTCFLKLDDGVGETTVMLPHEIYQSYKKFLTDNALITIKGKIFVLDNPRSKDNEERKVIGYSVKRPEINM